MEAPVVLFDWGETLMWIPGMIHDADRHLACVERIYDRHLRRWAGELPCAHFIDHYHEACRIQIRQSSESQREHGFPDRFAMALQMAGIASAPAAAELRAVADALGEEVVLEARLLEHAGETIETLAARGYRMGIVSNYPHGPVVEATLEKFGLRRHFAAIVVSSQTGWMKPHPGCYLPALEALGAKPERTLMVGDDLKNDVKGAKALGLHTAWLAPQATRLDADVDIHLKHLGELPARCNRLFS